MPIDNYQTIFSFPCIEKGIVIVTNLRLVKQKTKFVIFKRFFIDCDQTHYIEFETRTNLDDPKRFSAYCISIHFILLAGLGSF
jgi:hypothetical protein